MATYEQMMAKAKELYASGDTASAKRLAQMALDSKQPETNIVEQAGNGTNEGLAGLFGAPVDLLTSAINAGSSGIDRLTGVDLGQIENPIGGSQSIQSLMSAGGAITDAEPQTMGQRFARRAGQEVGAMAVPGAGLAAKAARPLQAAGLQGASALGAAGAGQATEEVTGSQTAGDIAALLGGLSPAGISRAARPSPRAPSIDELRADQTAAYGQVEQSNARLLPSTRDDLVSKLQGRIVSEGNPEFLENVTRRYSDKLDNLDSTPSIMDVEQMRRRIGSDIAGHSDSSTRRLGADLKEITDEGLRGLDPSQVTGSDPEGAIKSLEKGRELTSRIMKSELLDAQDTGILSKKSRQAGTSGTGGNELNSLRKGVASVLGDPKKKRQFNEQELALMRKIADGTKADNALRGVGRSLSPTTGALQGLANLGSVGATAATGNPLFLAPSAVGLGATKAGEARLSKQLEELSELIRNGGPVGKKATSDSESRAILSSLLSQLSSPAQQ